MLLVASLEIPRHYNMSGNRTISGTSGKIDVNSFNTWSAKLIIVEIYSNEKSRNFTKTNY